MNTQKILLELSVDVAVNDDIIYVADVTKLGEPNLDTRNIWTNYYWWRTYNL